MAITINGTNISAISFNGTAIGSVKFNGTEVFNRLVKYTFPNANAIMTSDSKYGFAISGGTNSSVGSEEYARTYSFNNNDENSAKFYSANLRDLYITFPEELRTSKITHLNVAWCDYASQTIYICNSPSAVYGSSGSWVKISEATGGVNKDISDTTNCAKICVHTTAKSANRLTNIGNFHFTFSVAASKLAAWKSKYNIS